MPENIVTQLKAITKDGAVTIPVDWRKELGLVPGQRVRLYYNRNEREITIRILETKPASEGSPEREGLGFSPGQISLAF
jgi:AbrB family looped-hinge helix DNA binding protein